MLACPALQVFGFAEARSQSAAPGSFAIGQQESVPEQIFSSAESKARICRSSVSCSMHIQTQVMPIASSADGSNSASELLSKGRIISGKYLSSGKFPYQPALQLEPVNMKMTMAETYKEIKGKASRL